MKTINNYFVVAILFPLLAWAGDPYQKQLKKLKQEMQNFGIQVGAFDQNPFQTGTTLSNYYLSEKTLLLQRDTFFQMRGNKLETTEQLADFQHRTKVLKMHANNIMIQLSQAIQNKDKDSLLVMEKEKTKKTLDSIIEECNQNSSCVQENLKKNETNTTHILIQNVLLSNYILEQAPYMHAFESYSVFHLVQLIYLEVLYSQGIMAKVEVDLFKNKNKRLLKNIDKNPNLSEIERDFQKEMVLNTYNKWRVRVLNRKYEMGNKYRELALNLQKKNQGISQEILKLRNDNPRIFKGMYNLKNCRKKWKGKRKSWCKSQDHLEQLISKTAKGGTTFLNGENPELPKFFWRISE